MLYEKYIIFPHQLFKGNPLIDLAKKYEEDTKKKAKIYLMEYFDDSCKAKMRLHMASMIYYNDYLKGKKFDVKWVHKKDRVKALKSIKEAVVVDPIEKEIKKLLSNNLKKVEYIDSPYFICKKSDVDEFTKKYNINKTNQETFYRWQRKRLNILMITKDKPMGGKYNYDKENRESLRGVRIEIPDTKEIQSDYYQIADKNIKYTKKNHGDERGFNYPCTHMQANNWLNNFLNKKLKYFGKYQDAVVKDDDTVFHSVISPMLNIGLLTPMYVIEKSIEHYNKNKKSIPLNSIEAFVRQILGWREFIRILYEKSDIKITDNYFGNNRKLSYAFYTGETGITPIDNMIKGALRTGYSHHIIRLMWLGNLFMLCQINPREVYNWFLELYIDAYEWVMIPNVIGMSQYADGGIVATRPYFSTSNYLKSMSDYEYKTDESKKWVEIWNALYYKFLDDKSDKLESMYIVSNWVKAWKKKKLEERKKILLIANDYLKKLNSDSY